MNRFSKITAVVALALTAGCNNGPRSHYETLNLVDVSGRVTIDGQPLANAVITFDNPTDGTFSYGATDLDGRYTLQLDSEKSGVTPGEKIVRISTTRRILGLNTDSSGEGATEGDDPDGPKKRRHEEVPEAYNRESNLRVSVEPGNAQHNFDLKSKI
jgi:hypothetical protein